MSTAAEKELTEEELFAQLVDEENAPSDSRKEEPKDITPQPEEPPGEKSADEEPAATTQEEQPKDGDDGKPAWYNNLNEEARAEFDRIRQDHDQLQRNYSRLHGQVAPVQRRLAQMERELQDARARPSSGGAQDAQVSSGAVAEYFKTPEWQKYKRDFPDEAAQLEAVYIEQSRQLETLQMQLTRAATKVEQATVFAETYQNEQLRLLSEAHSDYNEAVNSAEFHAWFTAQDAGIQALLQSYSASDNIEMLNLFKADLTKARELFQQQSQPQPTGQAPAADPQQPPSAPQQQVHARRMPTVSPGSQPSGVSGGRGGKAPLTEEELFAQLMEEELRK